ncbi:MAG TPA: BTAD domain-containing putative transcriptional regulator [Mycobacteriales bacterium]|nr:BTAD domain-containing putative transcriptional regulator [Mycobacteriales bacterium]
MEFRVLGPLEVGDGSRRLQLGAPMQRALLGQLLLTAGRTVPVEEIADRLWPDRSPQRPRNAVQLLVLRVRRALAEFGCDGLIESQPGGYRACTGEHVLDADRFAELVGQADDAAARGDTAAERALLADALALWRGPVLGQPATGWQSPAEAVRLDALRLDAGERLAAADIAAGHPERAVPLLRERLRLDPGRERATALLMLALHRGGRRAEALTVYRQAYRYATDELGLEPGAELRALQQDILRGDDPAPRTDPRPAALPNRLAAFVGRAELTRAIVDTVRQHAATGTAVCGITGMPGVGKSALALHVAYELRESFPDGQLHADLGAGTADPAAVLMRFLRLLGVPADAVPFGQAARAELFRARTSGRRILLVLDDAGSAAQLRALLPASAGSAVLVSARTAYTGVDGASWFRLDVLEPREGVALLTGLAGAGRIAIAPTATARVVDYCGGLPLALRIAGARLAARPSWSVTRLAAQLADPRRRLDELVADDMSVREAIGRGFAACTPRQRRALCLIGWLDAAEFSAWEAAAVLDEPLEVTTELVEQLVDAQLVQVRRAADLAGAVHYAVPDLIRLYAREQQAEPIRARHPELLRTAAL